MRQHLVYFEAAFHAPGFLFCVVYVCQDEETRSEALAMLDESSCCGNVQSSYLLWEKNRHTAVRHFFELTNEFMLGGYRLTLADFVFFFLQIADPGRYLQCVRTLRDYAAKGCWEAQVCVCGVAIYVNQRTVKLL